MERRRISMDGNQAAAYAAYPFTEVAVIYPITPSSPMSEHIDVWAAKKTLNIFGNTVRLTEMQNEKGVSGALHGASLTGALATTFTSSQGLMLMIPNMYKMAGERLPVVMHVATRALSTASLNMYGDHQDVMATRATGFAMLASGSVQEVMDLGPVAHLSAMKARVPFMHFFDGFRTSHEVQKIEVWDYKELEKLVDWDAIAEIRRRAFTPEKPVVHGAFEKNSYFIRTEASNLAYENVVGIVEEEMNKINSLLGTTYAPFEYYGDPEATEVCVCMGSATGTLMETVDALRAEGRKVGLIKVHLFRPFAGDRLKRAIPATAKRIAVLDRTKEKGSIGEPLLLDVKAAYYGDPEAPVIVGGRYGVGQKDTTPAMFAAVFDNLLLAEPKERFTIGVIDDVTFLSLTPREGFVIKDPTMKRCMFWGNGGDGTVGANKSAIKIIGDNTPLYVQGYFDYDAKKTNGVTVSHLRFSKNPIHSSYLLDEFDFVSCAPQAYVQTFDLLKGLRRGGTFLLNTNWTDEELDHHLPAKMRRDLARREINLYTIDATKIAIDVGLGTRSNMILQTAFFELAGVLPIEEAIALLKKEIKKNYGLKGQEVLDMNYAAVDRALEMLHRVEIPAAWADLEPEPWEYLEEDEFYRTLIHPVMHLEDDTIPVSAFLPYDDGTYRSGTSYLEKRGIAAFVPEWDPDACIQCNRCSFVCPHAAIRPFLLTEEEQKEAPEGFVTIPAIGPQFKGLGYRIQVSPLDCTGCGNCVDQCPAKGKAIHLKPLAGQVEKQASNWLFAHNEIGYKDNLAPANNVKNSQFRQPLLEFSGACAGCGETPYAKLITQLFGDHMYITNAAGCSSVWGGSVPGMPYCKNRSGQGPAWVHSLFEDNAEIGYGIALAEMSNRRLIQTKMEEFLELKLVSPLNALFREWIEDQHDYEATLRLASQIKPLLARPANSEEAEALLRPIRALEHFLVKKSVWMFGGDGWAYDIDFDGIDHVLASGENVNVMVFDTEVYSNTGGQSSKATPVAAVAKFAATGKRVRKKDLGLMMTSYGYVYVAQIAMGADQAQTLKALKEAEAYNGPSLIIAYAPCINHGIKAGMGKTQNREKLAVEAGYWHLWRFNPALHEEGKNPFILDSKEPKADFREFLMGEVRYTSLAASVPEEADELYRQAELAARERYEAYRNLADRA